VLKSKYPKGHFKLATVNDTKVILGGDVSLNKDDINIFDAYGYDEYPALYDEFGVLKEFASLLKKYKFELEWYDSGTVYITPEM
jgi:hypothetical protein